MVQIFLFAGSDEEELVNSDPNGSGRSSVGAMAKRAYAMWKTHENNPNLHKRPTERDTRAPGSWVGSQPRRMYVRPLQQIHKPLSLLTNTVRQVVRAGAVSMFGSAHATRIHDVPRSTAGSVDASMFLDAEARADSGSESSDRSAVQLQPHLPIREDKHACLIPAGNVGAGGTDASHPAAKRMPVAEAVEANEASEVAFIGTMEQHGVPAAPVAHTGETSAPVSAIVEQHAAPVAPVTHAHVPLNPQETGVAQVEETSAYGQGSLQAADSVDAQPQENGGEHGESLVSNILKTGDSDSSSVPISADESTRLSGNACQVEVDIDTQLTTELQCSKGFTGPNLEDVPTADQKIAALPEYTQVGQVFNKGISRVERQEFAARVRSPSY